MKFVHFLGYFRAGFLQVQRAVDLSIITELGCDPADVDDIAISLKAFPTPPHHIDSFTIVIAKLFHSLVQFSFLLIAIGICREIVFEKETHLKV